MVLVDDLANRIWLVLNSDFVSQVVIVDDFAINGNNVVLFEKYNQSVFRSENE